MKAVIVSFVIAFWGLSASACVDQGSGFVRGERLELTDCGDVGPWTPFDMELSYLSALRADDVVVIRASDTSQLVEFADSFVITIPSYEAVRTQIATEGAATVLIGPDGVVVSLALIETCPDSMTPLMGREGTITFTHLGTLTGERIAAELEFELINARSQESVGIAFRASIDFKVQAGTPYESFSDPRRQHGE
jgi:hypothetical protein